MIIYNVTILISEAKEQEFLDWMQHKHIQEVLDTKLFTKATFSKLISNNGETDGITYATQYYCESQDNLDKYYAEFAPKLREEGKAKFGEQMLGFRTELEVIQEF